MTDTSYIRNYNKPVLLSNPLYLGGTTYYFKNDGSLSAASGAITSLTSSTGTITTLSGTTSNYMTVRAQDAMVSGKLRATTYDLQVAQNTGGMLTVAPTLRIESGITVNSLSISSGTVSLQITHSSITSDSIGGITWATGHRVKVSANINGRPSGTLDGTITAFNAANHTITVSASGGDAANLTTTSPNTVTDLAIMVYERKDGSNYYPVGIQINCYDQANDAPAIRVYGGTSTKPTVFLGNFVGADLPTVNGVTPGTETNKAWGLYTDTGYFTGTIVSESGKIGGWTLGANAIYSGTNSMTSKTVGTYIGAGSAATSGIRNYASDTQYVNISQGKITAQGADITGTVDATSFTARDTNNVVRAAVDSSGLIVYDGSSNVVAQFGDEITIGKDADWKVKVSSDGLLILDTNDETVASYADYVRIGTESDSHTVIKSDETIFYGKDRSVSAQIKSGDLKARRISRIGLEKSSYVRSVGDFEIVNEGIPTGIDLDTGDLSVVFTLDGTRYEVSFNEYGTKTVSHNSSQLVVTFTEGRLVAVWENMSVGYHSYGHNTYYYATVSCPSFVFGDTDYDVPNFATTFGEQSNATGEHALSHGNMVIASGDSSFASGRYCKASGDGAHAEGFGAPIFSSGFPYYGYSLIASGQGSHAEGNGANRAYGIGSHAEGGQGTYSFGDYSHAQNIGTIAYPKGTTTIGKYNEPDESVFTLTTDTEIDDTKTYYTKSSTTKEFSEVAKPSVSKLSTYYEYNGTSYGDYAFIIGNGSSKTARSNAFSVDWNGNVNIASGCKYKINGFDLSASDIVGVSTVTNLVNGSTTGAVRNIGANTDVGSYASSLGYLTTASGYCSHAEGESTTGSGRSSHAEGWKTTASGYYSHAEGNATTASGTSSHAEGWKTTASGLDSHAEGELTTASGRNSHAEGWDTTASGLASHAEGDATIAQRKSQLTIGEYNLADTGGTGETVRGHYVFIIGNGTQSARSNALTVDWYGDVEAAGDVTDGSGNVLSGKQNTLVSGTNIKTVNNTSLLGSGNVSVQPTLVSGTNIKTVNGASLLGSGDVSVGVTGVKGNSESSYRTGQVNLTAADIGASTATNLVNGSATGSVRDIDAKTTMGSHAFAVGYNTTASGDYSHAEGYYTTASVGTSHAEGWHTTANGFYSHAEGYYTITLGQASHAQNFNTVAEENYQTVIGKYNKATVSGDGTNTDPYVYTDVGDYAFIIGNGTANTTAARSNALTVDWNGGIATYLDVDSTSATAATSGTDKDLFNSILTLGWTDCLTF